MVSVQRSLAEQAWLRLLFEGALSLHFALSDAARAGLAPAFAGTGQFQLAGRGGAVEAVIQFFAEGAAGEVSVDFALTLAMALHHNARRHMGEAYFVVRFVDFLSSFAPSAGECFFQISLFDVKPFHEKLEFLHFLR